MWSVLLDEMATAQASTETPGGKLPALTGGSNTVREKLLLLWELQKIDAAVLEIEKGAETIPKKIRELEDGLDVHRAELGTLNTEAETLRQEARDIEAHSSEESQKHRKWKTRLNDIKSPREYQALSRELELGERQIRDADEKALGLMQEIEDKQKVIDDKSGDLKSLEADVRGKVRELREAHNRLRENAEAAKTGRDAVLEKMTSGMKKKYDRVAQYTGGIAVAKVSDGTCMGCNMRLRPQHVVEIQRYDSIETCPNCQRILVHEDLVKSAELE